MNEEILLLWTKQLHKEFSAICYSYRLKLDPVQILVADLGNVLGRWDSFRRIISISSSLISQHPWGIVIEILKHEMAHQWVFQNYHTDDGHGPLFQTACTHLRVAAWARRAGIRLGDHLGANWEGNLSEKEQSLLRKTQKLLALAESNNEFEALAAMKKVKELYDRYHLENLANVAPDNYETLIINTKKKKVAAYQDMIVSILMKFYNVTCIYGRLYDAKSDSSHRVFEITGLSHNVAMADYVYSFLDNHVNMFWNDYKSKNPNSGLARRNQFLCGVVKGFRDKLELQQKELDKSIGANIPQTRALMLVEKKRLEEYERYLYPRLSKIRLGTVDVDSRAFIAGIKKGWSLTLHKGVRQEKSTRIALIDRR